MKTACTSFLREAGTDLSVSTALSKPSGETAHAGEISASWDSAWGQTVVFDDSLALSLKTGGPYPYDEAVQMLASLSWKNGLPLIIENPPDSLRFTMTYESCPLLPEYVPFRKDKNGSWLWLDCCVPISRRLDHVESSRTRHVEELSIALVYQEAESPDVHEGENFPRLAKEIQWKVRERVEGDIVIDTFSGSRFVGSSAKRLATLFEVFRRHRAVVFCGHLVLSSEDRYGWQLTRDEVLTMKELAEFLGVKDEKNRRLASLQRKAGWEPMPVPELVFAHCCFSAGRDPETKSRHGLSFPKLFLDAGVRFFVGTSRDVTFTDVRVPQTIAVEFLTNWANEPDHAIHHLYKAKESADFHLLGSLYQIYTSGEEQQSDSAVVSGITAGDILGGYVIERELWSDPYARTFWANHARNSTGHIVQVLVDEWQHSPGLPERLREAVDLLAEAGLGDGHLIPTRVGCDMLRRDGSDQCMLHYLLYDRPGGETASHWRALNPDQFGEAPEEIALRMLEFSVQVSQSVAQMHSKSIPHGNLGPSTVVVRTGGEQWAFLRDAWVWQCRPGRCAWPAYAPPEEDRGERDIDELKRDCWGLGLVFEHILEDTNPASPAHLPETLEKVRDELLVPSPRLRPNASFVLDRLAFAVAAGGADQGEFERILIQHIHAGHRLISVNTDNPDELEEVLRGLAGQGHRLYVAREEVGLVDMRQGTVPLPWITPAQIDEVFAQQAIAAGRPVPPPMGVAIEGEINGQTILGFLSELFCPNPSQVPVVLIRGARWWTCGPAGWRILRNIQAASPTSPVIIVADHHVTLDAETARHFVDIPLPPPTPAALFEHILGFPEASIPADQAMELAEKLYPISRLEATRSLRMCLHTHGIVDDRVLVIHDDAREDLFRRMGTLSYCPAAKLPAPGTVGLSRPLEADLSAWMDHIRAGEDSGDANLLRRVLVHGPEGSGKTLVASSLARRLERPLVWFDPGNCLRGRLGESEESLSFALAVVGWLQRCVVLLDDVERFFQSATVNQDGSLGATMQRMSAKLLHWLDHLPPGCVMVITASTPKNLPEQWSWRMDRTFQLPSADVDMVHRQAVFAAVLRNHGLDALAADEDLVVRLARDTDPTVGIPRLASPSARAAKGPLAQLKSSLASAADIASWVSETIMLFGRAGNPEEEDFWLDALTPIEQGAYGDG